MSGFFACVHLTFLTPHKMHYKYNIKVNEGIMIMNFICIKQKGKEMMQ
ncbi:hypothetical protein CSC12_0192 [Klebsiella michiganensis]|nr:hypothetical protein CSC12_0192 [Klebsiella michiganensis]